MKKASEKEVYPAKMILISERIKNKFWRCKSLENYLPFFIAFCYVNYFRKGLFNSFVIPTFLS